MGVTPCQTRFAIMGWIPGELEVIEATSSAEHVSLSTFPKLTIIPGCPFVQGGDIESVPQVSFSEGFLWQGDARAFMKYGINVTLAQEAEHSQPVGEFFNSPTHMLRIPGLPSATRHLLPLG